MDHNVDHVFRPHIYISLPQECVRGALKTIIEGGYCKPTEDPVSPKSSESAHTSTSTAFLQAW